LILPVVICLSQRLSHACLSISNYTVKLRMACNGPTSQRVFTRDIVQVWASLGARPEHPQPEAPLVQRLQHRWPTRVG